MIRTPITNSSNISGIAYDPETSTLEIEYKSGDVFQYHKVSVEKFAALMADKSLGSHLHKNIKGFHEYTKVTT